MQNVPLLPHLPSLPERARLSPDPGALRAWTGLMGLGLLLVPALLTRLTLRALDLAPGTLTPLRVAGLVLTGLTLLLWAQHHGRRMEAARRARQGPDTLGTLHWGPAWFGWMLALGALIIVFVPLDAALRPWPGARLACSLAVLGLPTLRFAALGVAGVASLLPPRPPARVRTLAPLPTVSR